MKTQRNRFFSYAPLSDKEKKNFTIFDLLRKKGSVSRTEIAKITGLKIVSVSNYVNNYINKKLVIEKGLDVSSGGRKPELVELNTQDNRIIGLDIGETEIKVLLTDLGINILEKAKVLASRTNYKYTLDACLDLVGEALKKCESGKNSVRAIGIGVSNINFINIGQDIANKVGIETFVGNRAFCAAYGERTLNQAAGYNKEFVYMYSDLGEGVIVKGDICLTADTLGAARDSTENITHEISEEIAEHLKYLKPWNAHLGIIYGAKREVAKGIGTKIVTLSKGRLDGITKDIVIEAAKESDDVASNIIEGIGMNLGIRTAYIINLFKPALVVVGGGVESAGDLIISRMDKMIKKFSFRKEASLVKIIPAALGVDAVSLGASGLAQREIFLRA